MIFSAEGLSVQFAGPVMHSMTEADLQLHSVIECNGDVNDPFKVLAFPDSTCCCHYLGIDVKCMLSLGLSISYFPYLELMIVFPNL